MKKVIKNKTFIAHKEETQSKFSGGSALGFSWRPGQEEYELEIRDCVIDGSGAGEGLKLSFCSNVTVSNCIIYGGYEDCVDIVRGSNICFNNCVFVSNKTKQHITIKGGAKNIVFTDCEFRNNFKSIINGACVDLGNWTDYDDAVRPKTRSVKIINCKFNNITKKILSRVIYAERPIVENSDGFVFRIPTFIVKLFWFGQRKGWLGKRRSMPKEWLEVYPQEL
jgi:hypothetical protein